MQAGKSDGKRNVIKDVNALKKWIANKISIISDAEPETLTPYIIVLLKKSTNVKELKNTCLLQLEVFLKSHTATFVNELFECIATEEYLREDHPHMHTAIENVESAPNTFTTDMSTDASQPANQDPINDKVPISTSRERDRDYKTGSHGRLHRGRGRHSSSSSSSRSRSPPEQLASSVTVADPSFRRTNPPRDMPPRRDPGDLRFKLNSGTGGMGFKRRYQQRCRDYDTKGVCLKGDKCPYSHGTDALVTASTLALQLLSSGVVPTFPLAATGTNALNGSAVPSVPEYNASAPPPPLPEWPRAVYQPSPIGHSNRGATHSNLISVVTGSAPSSSQTSPQKDVPPGYEPTCPEPPEEPSPYSPSHVGEQQLHSGGITTQELRARGAASNRQFTRTVTNNRYQPYQRPGGRFNEDQGSRGFRGGGGGGFGYGRPNHPRFNAQHCIKVTNIPPGKDNVGDLHNCFKEFGHISKVELLTNQPHCALIYYAHEHEVERAYRHTGMFLGSPQVEVKPHQPQQRFNPSHRPRFPSNSTPQEKFDASDSGSDADGHNSEFSDSRRRRDGGFVRERKVSDSSRSSRNNALEERRRLEKDMALKERQEQIALLEKAKESHQKMLVTTLTTILQKLMEKYDSTDTNDSDSVTVAMKKQLREHVVESSRYLEQLENGQCNTEELFKHIPEYVKRVSQRYAISVARAPLKSGPEQVTATAPGTTEKKPVLKLDARSSVIYVTGLTNDKPDEEVQGFCTLLTRSNMAIDAHQLCDTEMGQSVLAVKFATRQDAEKAVRGIKKYRGRDISLSFSPPLGMIGNVFQEERNQCTAAAVSEHATSGDFSDEMSPHGDCDYLSSSYRRRHDSLTETVKMVVNLSEDENMAEFDHEDDGGWNDK